MKNRIIEIVELGKPQSIIHREGEPITEMIKTDVLVKEVNEQFLLYNVRQQSELLKAFVAEFIEAWEDGSGGDSDLYRKAKSLL